MAIRVIMEIIFFLRVCSDDELLSDFIVFEDVMEGELVILHMRTIIIIINLMI